jgi:hypothetical protein
MSHPRFSILLTLWLMGCATPAERVVRMSYADLCYRTVYGDPAMSNAAHAELERRKLRCEPGMAAAEASRRDAANQAIGDASMRLITPPPAPPAPVTCVTTGRAPYQITTCR